MNPTTPLEQSKELARKAMMNSKVTERKREQKEKEKGEEKENA